MAKPQTIHTTRVSKDVTIDPGNIVAAASIDVTATVKGLRKGGRTKVWAESLEAGLVICNEHASAKDTLKFRLANVTAGAINPASQTFRVVQD